EHLANAQLHLLAGQRLEVLADPVGIGATPTDHDARAGRVDRHRHPVAGALDLDPADPGAVHALGEELADRHVFADVRLVQLGGEPSTLVVGRDAETEAVRVYFLAHLAGSFPARNRADDVGRLYDERDVAGSLVDPAGPALRPGTEPLEGGSLV